jgi:hypothetical protein
MSGLVGGLGTAIRKGSPAKKFARGPGGEPNA